MATGDFYPNSFISFSLPAEKNYKFNLNVFIKRMKYMKNTSFVDFRLSYSIRFALFLIRKTNKAKVAPIMIMTIANGR